MKISPDADAYSLGEAAGVPCSVAVTRRPWLLGADALVVSASPEGFGQLARSVRKALPGLSWERLSLESLSPQEPQVLEVGPDATDGLSGLRWIVIASARDTTLPRSKLSREHPGTPEAAALGVGAAVRMAARLGVETVALPLLGAGDVGLDLHVAAEANVLAVQGAIMDLGRSSVRRIMFVCADDRTLQAIQNAWPLGRAPVRPASGESQAETFSGSGSLGARMAASTEAEQPATEKTRPGQPGTGDVPHYPYLSATALDVLGHATALAPVRTQDPGTIDPPLVLLSAFVRRRGSQGDAAGVLATSLAGGQDRGAFVARIASALDVPVEFLFTEPVTVQAIGAFEPVLLRSRDLARRTGRTEVDVRHVLAAVVTSDPPLPASLLGILDVSAEELRRRLREAVRATVPDEAPAQWDDILGVLSEATQLAGGVSRDLVDVERGIPLEDDHLGVGRYVTMLAAVIARRNTPLPLSVGLFGEWGSGKSYFMGLLREQVRALGASGDEAYLPEIEQITFNAWHYADTNLWASLGNEIFEQLAGPRPTADERRRAIRTELTDKLQRAQQLKAANAQAQRETTRLHEDIERAWIERADSAIGLVKSVASSPTISENLSTVWKRLGVEEPVEQGRLLADEVRGSRADVSTLRLVTAGKRGLIATVLAALALLALAVAAVVPDQWTEAFTRGGLAGLATLLAGATVTVRRVRSGLAQLSKVASEVRAGAEERADEAVAQDLDRLREADAHESVVRAQLDEVLQRVGELGRELAALSPGQRLYGFVSERAASQDYRRELGLISTIRRDFEHLIELMDDWRRTDDRDEDHRPIDRIVLYIDDLDRCSPKQVVDVLQAVHLLLALELFVVVVGVDPRWLLHSLRQNYGEVFGALPDAEAGDEAHSWRTTPQDYLEKIFNIPFVLPGMTGGSFQKLIRELSAEPPADPEPVKRGPVPAPRNHSKERSSAPVEAGAVVPDVPAEPTTKSPPAEVPIETGSEIAAIQEGVAPPPPRGLLEAELQLLGSLGPLVHTPREAKRLLNLYRMVRSTRDLSPAAEFLGTERQPGEFQAVAILLGLLTAHPRLLGDLLAAPAVDGIAGGLCHRPTAQTWPEVVQGLRPRQVDGRWSNDVCPSLPDAQREEWDELVRRVAPASAAVRLPDLKSFQRWGSRIARFSFLLSPLATEEETVGTR